MPIEKLAGDEGVRKQTDVKDFIKEADQRERVVFLDMSKFMGKEAVAVFATGARAAVLRELLEEHD